MNHNEIVNNLKSLVREERKITGEILNHLRTIEAQKIFASLGHSSLFEFCMKELGYSEGAAQRRISAMRLIKDLPEVEEKIVSGSLSLSVASQAQSFFRKKKHLNKPMDRCQKIDLLKKLDGASSRESEKLLLQLEPDLITTDKERLVTSEHLEIKITVDKEFMNNLEKLKDLLSHQMPFARTKDILAHALKELIKRKDPQIASRDSTRRDKRIRGNEETPAGKKPTTNTSITTGHIPPPASAVNTEVHFNRCIPKRIKQQVWEKSKGQCSYINHRTGQKCNSTRFLEIDHIFPKSRGGTNSAINLQLLCDTHNRLKSNGPP